VEAVRNTVRAAIERGIEYLTLFAFSSENWRRPADEVSILMDLFLRSLEQEVAKLHDNGIRFKTIGDMTAFDSRIRELVSAGEAMTAKTSLDADSAATAGAAHRAGARRSSRRIPVSCRRTDCSEALEPTRPRYARTRFHPHRRRAAISTMLWQLPTELTTAAVA
jgi:undecaprenyl diphosphate synthase